MTRLCAALILALPALAAAADTPPPLLDRTTTLWIAKDSLRVVKTSASLPQMGGATITSELKP